MVFFSLAKTSKSYPFFVNVFFHLLGKNPFLYLFYFLLTQNKSGLAGSCSPFSGAQIRRTASVRVVALGSNGRAGERNASILIENTLKEMREGSVIDDVDSKPTIGGGVQDVYGEDAATEEQFVTPWSLSVAR